VAKNKRKPGQHHPTTLDLFAGEFDSEDKLRRVVAELFRKMGHKGVRITHGSSERGKDIVFQSKGPLGETRLFACVIKNDPITGRADDFNNGAPTIVSRIQGVINQIQSAFSEPIPNGSGVDERIDSVYVISPFDCPTTTIESVKNVLERSGQIVFKCGHELLELFADHWSEFLCFESSVLLSYLTALRTGLEEDYALANLVLRKAFLARSPGGLADLYVEPTFYRELKVRHRRRILGPNLDLLIGSHSYAEIQQEIKNAKLARRVLRTGPTWADDSEISRTEKIAEDVVHVAEAMAEHWDKAYQHHVATILEESRRSGRRQSSQGYATSRYAIDGTDVPRKSEVNVELNPDHKLRSDASEIAEGAALMFSHLEAAVDRANAFASKAPGDALDSLCSPAFLSYSQISDTEKLVPFVFDLPRSCEPLRFSENLLDDFTGCLLITGPAGFGKTTFCRWHAIGDANRLVEKRSAILPVYVQLHALSSGKLVSGHDAFFRAEALRKLLQLQSAGQSPFDRIRLYLDGLDEVTSLDRQKDIVRFAQELSKEMPFLQVILTGRDHVAGPWLKWLPRVRLSPLSKEKSCELATKWLGADRVETFFARLNESENLMALMEVPLLATLILAVYRNAGTVPPNKTTLYALFVELLCGGWDVYKNIQRRENIFRIKDKMTVLTRFAGILQLENKRDATEGNFRVATKNTFPAFLPECDQLLNEIVEDGLLVRMGTSLAFSHLSFQEFLAARDLQDPTGNRPKLAMARYFRGEDWWREVLSFYVTMSERPAEMDEWISLRALASTSSIVDLEERLSVLKRSLFAAFPAYQEVSVATKLFAEVKAKADRLAGRRQAELSETDEQSEKL
jgi:hypothetical protein